MRAAATSVRLRARSNQIPGPILIYPSPDVFLEAVDRRIFRRRISSR
jgi:hypothetical protein